MRWATLFCSTREREVSRIAEVSKISTRFKKLSILRTGFSLDCRYLLVVLVTGLHLNEAFHGGIRMMNALDSC